MALIRRTWTAKEADQWTREDLMTVIISPIIYGLLSIGVALSALLLTVGFVLLGIGIFLLLAMIYIINPKLSVVSQDYEKKQKQYLDELEKKVAWEDMED
jgi:ABC-type multidrug transport system permease subunit